MSWKITHDILTPDAADEFHRVGKGRELEALKAIPVADRITFRLLDDDLEHYYTGQVSPDGYADDDRPEGLYGAYQWAMNDSGCTHCCITLDDAVRLGMRPDIAAQIAFKTGPHKGWVSLYS